MTRALVVFESMFGNTEAIARHIADGLSASMDVVDVQEVGVAPAGLADDLDLLIVGGPTHAFGLSRPATRQQAAEQSERPLVSRGIGLREWLEALHAPHGLAAAAFGTKIDKRWIPGAAAAALHKRLRGIGMRMLGRPESFLVSGTPGPLLPGEIERAREWGARLGTQVTAGGRAR